MQPTNGMPPLNAPTGTRSGAPGWSDTRAVFAAMLHQLSQPLTVLRGQLELSLLKARTPQEYRRAIERAIAEAERLIELFRSARRVAEVAEESPMRSLSLSAVVRAACEDLTAVAASEDVRLVTEIQPDVAVLGKSLSLKETVFNLVNFAIHRCGRGGSMSLSLLQQSRDAVLRIHSARRDAANPLELRPQAVLAEEASAPAALPDDWVLAVARCTLASMGAALETTDNAESAELDIVFRSVDA